MIKTKGTLIGGLALSGTLLSLGCMPRQYNNNEADLNVWDVVNTKWNDASEEDFSKWIEQLGNARADKKCSKLGSCLQNPVANKLYNQSVDSRMDVFADCADVPMVLRAYYAYKMKLPFSFVSDINGSQYSRGNTPSKWTDQSSISSITKLFSTISSDIHSGHYRMAPAVENTDTYPIDISRKTVKPGTVFYDPNGHVLIVYKVEANGIVRLMDGHPDNSLTIQTFGEKFARGGTTQGGGFRNFRRLEYVNGKVVRQANAASPGFNATAQYQSKYNLGEQGSGDYYKWIRYTLATDGGQIHPETEMQDKLNQLCVDIKDRINSVNAAISKGINSKAHPSALPSNIYGTDGEWEAYSTPSRDARLKASFREIHSFIKDSMGWLQAGDKRLVYTGSNKDLVALYKKLWDSNQCTATYSNSKGKEVSLNLNLVMDRLFALSFDPYHCAELRWGAPIGSPEFATCPDSTDKLKWYKDEYKLRNTIEREYGAPTPITWGEEQAADINIPKLLSGL